MTALTLTAAQAASLAEWVAMPAGRIAAEMADTLDPEKVKRGYAELNLWST